MLKIFSAEFLFILYTFSFVLLKPVFYYIHINTTLVLILTGLAILSLYLLKNHSMKISRLLDWSVICATFLSIWGIQKILNPNYLMNEYLINFVIYAVIPLFLLIGVNDFKKILLYVFRISIFVGLILWSDPLFGYRFTSDYMQYGFNMFMFSYAGLFIGTFYFHKKIMWLPIIFELICIAFWGNKGAFISAATLLLLVLINMIGSKLMKFVASICAIIGIFFYEKILLGVIEFAEHFNIKSYSISTFKIMLSSNSDVVYDARLNIWKEAFKYIKQNPIFGSGIATFEEITGQYAHNIFIDILLTFGLFGLTVFSIFIIYSLTIVPKSQNTEVKIFQIGCFICWFVAMQFSLTFWNVILFWIYWGVNFYGFLNEKDGLYE